MCTETTRGERERMKGKILRPEKGVTMIKIVGKILRNKYEEQKNKFSEGIRKSKRKKYARLDIVGKQNGGPSVDVYPRKISRYTLLRRRWPLRSTKNQKLFMDIYLSAFPISRGSTGN